MAYDQLKGHLPNAKAIELAINHISFSALRLARGSDACAK